MILLKYFGRSLEIAEMNTKLNHGNLKPTLYFSDPKSSTPFTQGVGGIISTKFQAFIRKKLLVADFRS